jgi:tellurite resistance protein TerC
LFRLRFRAPLASAAGALAMSEPPQHFASREPSPMEFLVLDVLGKPAWMWGFFLCLVVLLLVFDLGVLHRRPHEIGITESFTLSAFYIALSLAFGGFVWWELGQRAGLEYVTGFVIEKSLAIDNIFVIAMIFGYFAIPRIHQHRALVYGILGVVVLRGIMIGAGTALISSFEWVLYLFAAFLIVTGIKMLVTREAEYDVSANPVLPFLRQHLRVTDRLHGHAFFVTQPHPESGRQVLWATPLFLALVMVELADVVFAVDSIPAIFAVTTDPYIVFTSNLFAILGLRALYFALAAMIHRFVYMKFALASVLIFVGAKVFAADLLGIEKVPSGVSLSVTLFMLAAGIAVSLWKT